MNSAGHVEASGQAKVHIGNYYSVGASSDRNRCLADLRLADPREEKARIEQTKGGLFRDSYKWILDNDKFRRWQHDKRSRVLWIKGDAGKGKTMLLYGIINELSQSAPDSKTGKKSKALTSIVNKLSHRLKRTSNSRRCGLSSYFFCQATDTRLNTAVAVLRGLIYLLLVQEPRLVTHIQERYEHGGRQILEGSNAFFSVSQALLDMLRDPIASGAVLIVDALDECKTGLPQLLDFIVDTTSTSYNVKWVVSSRSRHEIEQRLQLDDSRMRLSLELNAEHVEQAIYRYVDFKVSSLASLRDNASLQSTVRDRIIRKSDGTFLWAALVIQELENTQSWRISTVLEQVPPGLVPLYDRMAELIERIPPEEKDVCRLILSAATTAYRPLHLKELGIVSGLSRDITSHTNTIERAVDICGSFLTIRDSYVYLVHQSAKDYMTDSTSTAGFRMGLKAIHSLYNIFKIP